MDDGESTVDTEVPDDFVDDADDASESSDDSSAAEEEEEEVDEPASDPALKAQATDEAPDVKAPAPNARQVPASNTERFVVVVNAEEQLSTLPANRELPLGWRQVGEAGSKEEVMNYVKDAWADKRPRSLRKTMEENEARHRAETKPNN